MSTNDDLNISNVGSYDPHTHPLITAMHWFLIASHHLVLVLQHY